MCRGRGVRARGGCSVLRQDTYFAAVLSRTKECDTWIMRYSDASWCVNLGPEIQGNSNHPTCLDSLVP